MIVPVEARSHKVELTDIQFPSRDGFLLQPRMVVEYAVQASKAPELLVRLADSGVLHQADVTADDKANNEVLQKVILPHIRGYARIEGSNFDARDFIVSAPAKDGKQRNAREALQQALLKKVSPRCAELGVEIRAVTLADMHPPQEIAEQIAQRELARVELEKNVAQVRQFHTAQELAAKQALKAQAKEKVEAQTRLLQAKTKADQMLEVETLRLKQELDNAQLQLDAGQESGRRDFGQRQSGSGRDQPLTNAAEVSGLRKAVEGFSGAQAFAQYHVVSRLAPALTEIFASDASDFAKLFSGYMTAPASGHSPKGPAPTATAGETSK